MGTGESSRWRRCCVGAAGDRARSLALLLGVIASAMLIGDGLLTPAISVLSAVQGLELVAPDLADLVPELTVLVLIALFAIQYRGTAKVGKLFGPVMLIWFLILAGTGLVWILKVPGVLVALDPRYAYWLIQDNGWAGFLTLGIVFRTYALTATANCGLR